MEPPSCILTDKSSIADSRSDDPLSYTLLNIHFSLADKSRRAY